MKKAKQSWLLALACGGPAICLPYQALAQTAKPAVTPPKTDEPVTAAQDTRIPAAGTGASTGDIIVTAQKRSERIQDVPLAIVAATGSQLKTLGITNPEQLDKLVPGFTFARTVYGQPVFFLRGVGFNDTALGVSPSVAIYTDQIPIPFSAMARGTNLDLERVEVLKGPQGTLFGQNSTGGAINFIAAKPTQRLAAGFDLTVGRFNEVDAEAFLSGPITNTLSARLAVRDEYRGNWQRGYTIPETLGKRNFHNARLTIDWHPASAVRVELTATGWQDKSDTQQLQLSKVVFNRVGPGAYVIPFPIATVPPAPNDARAAAWTPGENYRRDDWFYQFGGRVDVRLSDAVNLTSLTSYARYSQSVPTDFDGTVFPLIRIVNDGTIRSFSQELRLSGSLSGGRVKWMIGGNYQNDRIYDTFLSFPLETSSSLIGGVKLSGFRPQNLQTVRTKAGFASLDFKLTDTLTAQGSLRYTQQDRNFSGCLRDLGDGTAAAALGFLSFVVTGVRPVIAPGACVTLSAAGPILPNGVMKSLNENNVSYRAGLAWKPNSDTLIYANVTKGYKSGSFSTIPYINELEAAPAGQESILAYEIGAKLSAFSKLLQVSGAAFYYDYRNKQVNGYISVPPLGAFPGLVSVPKSRIRGAEISATLRPVDGLTLSANGSYIDTEIQSNPVNPTGPFNNPANFIGKPFPVTPKWQSTFDAQYKFPVNTSLSAYVGGNVTTHSSANGVFLSGDPAVAANEALLKIPAYALVDVRAGLETEGGKWRVEAFGRNITSKYYLIGTSRNADYILRFAGMPVTYGLSLFYRY